MLESGLRRESLQGSALLDGYGLLGVQALQPIGGRF